MKQRELQFRVWTGREMFNFMDLKEWDIEDYNDFHFRSNRPQAVVMQFTGKVDASKNEIYEGDILRATDEGEFGDINHYFIVTWISEWCIFAAISWTEYGGYLKNGAESLDETMFWTFNLEQGDDYTVCANLYEHPDYIQKCMQESDESMSDEFQQP